MHLMAASQRHSQARPEIVHDLVAARAGVLLVVAVVVLRGDVHADFADVAMEEVLTAACLACATLVAVEYLLAQIVFEQVTFLAEVLAERYLAFLVAAFLCRCLFE